MTFTTKEVAELCNVDVVNLMKWKGLALRPKGTRGGSKCSLTWTPAAVAEALDRARLLGHVGGP